MAAQFCIQELIVSRVLLVVTVGETQDWLPELVERAKGLKVGNGFDPEVEMCVVLL